MPIMNMPKLGVNMTDATIVEWVVKPGDEVKEGDHILDAETDKAVQEIYATVSGVLTKILAPEGEEVKCQDPIAVFTQPGEEAAEAEPAPVEAREPDPKLEAEKTGPAEAPKEKTEARIPGGGSPAPATNEGRRPISPLARKMARDMAIDIAELQPKRPGARIVKADVLRYLETRTTLAVPAPELPEMAGDTIPYTGTRKRIGRRLTESWQEKPAAALTLHANVERLIEWRRRLKAAGKAAGYTDMMVMIAARALREYPIINSRLEGSDIRLLDDINIGVAVDADKGLSVPVIRNADKKSLLTLGEELRKKAEAVRDGSAGSEDLTGGTFTITNLGMYEIENFTPVINPPECCILAMGAIVREPVVDDDDTIVIRSRMQITLVFDHRIVDGAPAARFLQRVKQLAEYPVELLC